MTNSPRWRRAKAVFVVVLGLWLLATTLLVTVAVSRHKNQRAMIEMGWGLIVLWILVGGTLMWRFRDRIRALVLAVPWDWRVKFILFATLLALLEEAITTTMTNLAPLFGVAVGQAYITASANYFDVVALHSVVLFIPLFVAWALFLSRYDFSPFAVFILFGMTGTLAEMSFGGPQHLLEFGLWIFVYGLMVYLPAYSVPSERTKRKPGWWLYPLAVVVPFAFEVLVPTGLVVGLLYPGHPKIHFPPIQ
jgi:hypothetical protein